jgi:hypothetical protein
MALGSIVGEVEMKEQVSLGAAGLACKRDGTEHVASSSVPAAEQARPGGSF